jgi:hypothetical protein
VTRFRFRSVVACASTQPTGRGVRRVVCPLTGVGTPCLPISARPRTFGRGRRDEGKEVQRGEEDAGHLQKTWTPDSRAPRPLPSPRERQGCQTC